jgi:ubiquinone biosynthesis protein COQ9
MVQAADLTLDELRIELAPQIAEAAIFDGWSDAALVSASAAAGVNPAVARLAFAGGAMDMIESWVASVDARMEAAFDRDSLARLPIRERIRSLVWFRVEAMLGLEEALRRALAIEAMPQNVVRTAKLGWASADRMWRLAGDTATDYNHYTKRAILGGVYGATLAVFIDDDSEAKAQTRAFLQRRIDGVMRFERAKARWLARSEHFDPVRFLGRLRYPAR